MNAAKHLLGIGCPDCDGGCNMDGLASDPTLYDTITVGGKQYSANQLVDKNLIAAGTVPAYLASDFTKPFITFKAGDLIGNVYSYINPTQQTAINAGSPLLMFYTSDNRPYFVKDDSAINTQALKDSGSMTVAEETAANQAAQDKANNPIEYYFKTYGLKILLIGGGIYTVVQIAKAFIDKPRAPKETKTQTTETPAMAGHKKKRK